jgi:hypothetical protein
MNIVTKYVLNLIVSTALAVFACAVLFGWHDFTDALGGVKSFAGLVAVLVMCAIILGGILFLQDQDYTDRWAARITHLIIAFAVVIVLGLIGWNWVDLPNGAGAKVLSVMVACIVAAAIETLVGYIEDE